MNIYFLNQTHMLVDIFGILNLAMRLFSLLAVCVWIVSTEDNCKTLQAQANGALKSGTYTVQNSAGQSYRIYCQFYSGYGYTFLSTSTNVNVDMSSLYDNKDHVIIRHKRSTGVQYTSTMSQLTAYASTPVSVQYSAHSGYKHPQNTQMAPYVFVGFIPISMTYQGAVQGWKVNGGELTFTNCNGDPNSYITFFFNPTKQGYSAYVGDRNSTIMYQWYDGASVVPFAEYLPDEFFANFHEVHQGGCGGYSRGSNVPCGGAVGMKFNIECGVPAKVDGAQMRYMGTAIGHTSKYQCLAGYQHTGGDLARTCSGSGAWSGTTPVCGNINDCAPAPCKNGGQCTDGLNAYTCACAAGFKGTVCEININECDPNPCLNGAQCIDEINAYKCACAAGYQGSRCEKNINDCAPAPCKNGGQCTDGLNAYTCACAAGFNGTVCETNINDCAPAPCKNGGQCTDGLNAYTCACAAGFNGTVCETNINECDPNPCLNGAHCFDGIEAYMCACEAGYQGSRCEKRSTTIMVVGIAVAVVIVIAAVVIVIILRNMGRACFKSTESSGHQNRGGMTQEAQTESGLQPRDHYEYLGVIDDTANQYFELEKPALGNGESSASNKDPVKIGDDYINVKKAKTDEYEDIDDRIEVVNNDYDFTSNGLDAVFSENTYNRLNTNGDDYDHIGMNKRQT